jgi:aspartate-semialdehyde dehydrogenase
MRWRLHPGTLLRAPWVERELGAAPKIDFSDAPVVVAHPAAVVLALLLLRAQKVGKIARAIVTVLEPASEHGRRGMDELHEQTVNLLSFQQLPKVVFDAQVAFNIVDRYGEKAAPALSSVEEPHSAPFSSIVQGRLNVPSLMLLQAPIFHGHAFSLYIELESAAQMKS